MLGLFRRPAIRLSLFAKTDLGRVRDHNEDRFLVADLTRGSTELSPDLRDHEVGKMGSLLMVADGMGGAAAGEVASEMATDVVFRHLSESGSRNARSFAQALVKAVEKANDAIHSYSGAHPEYGGMGTTATAAGITGDEVFVAQVGDSRAYVVRGELAAQITKDQSLTQKLVDDSRMTEAEALQSERRNVILQALGPAPTVEVEMTRHKLRAGDVLVLCSDGLTGFVADEEIGQVVARTRDPAVACEDLVELANSRGGRDNITVIVARCDGEGLKDPVDGEAVAPHVFQP